MNRLEFLKTARNAACTACAALVLTETKSFAAATPTPVDELLKEARDENAFTKNWLSDLFETIDAECDPATKMKLIEGCGRGCFRRHKFKTDLAEKGRGNLERLLEAYRENFNVSLEDRVVHIRYSDRCFCPAAKGRPFRKDDLQCECTRASHQAIFEAALGKRFRADVAESIRRGGKTCHIRVYLS